MGIRGTRTDTEISTYGHSFISELIFSVDLNGEIQMTEFIYKCDSCHGYHTCNFPELEVFLVIINIFLSVDMRSIVVSVCINTGINQAVEEEKKNISIKTSCDISELQSIWYISVKLKEMCDRRSI